MQDFNESVKAWFHVDFFQLLQSLENANREMTAAEVTALQGEKAAALAGLVNNLNQTLNTIVLRTWDICNLQGILPPTPQALIGSGARIKPHWNGILAQAQRRAHLFQGIAAQVQMEQALAPLAEGVPDVLNGLDWMDHGELVKASAEANGLSQKIIREADDVRRIEAQRAQAQAAQAQIAMQTQTAQANKDNAQARSSIVQAQRQGAQ
jgi:hypothetical protein